MIFEAKGCPSKAPKLVVKVAQPTPISECSTPTQSMITAIIKVVNAPNAMPYITEKAQNFASVVAVYQTDSCTTAHNIPENTAILKRPTWSAKESRTIDPNEAKTAKIAVIFAISQESIPILAAYGAIKLPGIYYYHSYVDLDNHFRLYKS